MTFWPRLLVAAFVALTVLAGCGSERRNCCALPPPHAGNREVYGGAGRDQHVVLRRGDTLTVAISEQHLRACLGRRPGCVAFRVTGRTLRPLQAPFVTRQLCNDARHRCVYARTTYRTRAAGSATVEVGSSGGPRLLRAAVEVRESSPAYRR